MKKIVFTSFMAALACAFALAGCSSGARDGQSDPDAAFEAPTGAITVISREDGSGTRGAFVELFDVRDENGEDATALSAEITNNTAVMMTSVAGGERAVGYISLGSLNDSVKALKIDGVKATIDNINNGSYTVSRPFLIALKGEPSPVAGDFIGYIMSADGQNLIESNGYVKADDGAAPFTSVKPAGKIIIAGSSSVTPVMEKLSEAYIKINPDADIEIQQSDSSTGMNAVVDGVCDVGMASRELKDSEIEKGLSGMTFAMDGVAVIVNPNNPIDDLSKEQVRDVFSGAVTDWSELR
jgi:phosphate transport system substrate-binding protein